MQMTLLPISSPPPAPRETVYSYLGRLAATWETEVVDLAYDMGAPFKRILAHDPDAFEALARWANLSQAQLNDLLSWTGDRVGNSRMEFRDNVFVSRALRNPVVRGCPVCLREDADGKEGKAGTAMVMRGDWLLREVSVCIRHRHPLVPLWTSKSPRDRYDVRARLREIEPAILKGELDQEETPPQAYDKWLDDRLADGHDETWLNGQPLFAATTFCRLLGHALLLRTGAADGVIGSAFHTAGFAVARHGEDAIRNALDRIAAAATGPNDEPQKAFGPLYPGLNRDYAGEAGFDCYAALLRACILDHWPIAPGQALLGEVVTERRLHSLNTAARETGVGVEVLEQFLIEAGALKEDDDRPSSRRIFDAPAYAGLIAEIPTLVGPIAMRNAIGATKREFEVLEEEGILFPRTRVAKLKNSWRLSDGAAVLATLQAKAVPVAGDDGGWESLLRARTRTRVRVGHLVDAIRNCSLPVGQRVGVAGFSGIMVPKHDVDRLVAEAGKDRAPHDVPTSLLSAAAFGRSVGLRDHGDFVALVEAGHTPAREELNAKTQRLQYRVDRDDIAAFHRNFVTLTTLSAETGVHRNTLKARLEACKVVRFSPDGRDFGPVFLRSEAAQALR